MSNDSVWVQPGGTPKVGVGSAISYASNRFRANWVPWVIVGLPLLAVLYFQAISSVAGGPVSGSASLSIAAGIITFVAGLFYKVILTRGALLELDGRRPAIGDFFAVPKWGPPLLTALLVSLLTNLPVWILPRIAGWFVVYGRGGGVLGLIALLLILLTLVLTLAVVFFTFFAVTYTLDQQVPPVEALKASFSVIRHNFRQLLVLAIANVGIVIAGALPCGLGLPVAIPVVLIASTYAYRVLVLGPVTPIDPEVPPGATAEPPYPPMPPA